MVPNRFFYGFPPGWDGYITEAPNTDAVEQLDRVVRTHRDELGATDGILMS